VNNVDVAPSLLAVVVAAVVLLIFALVALQSQRNKAVARLPPALRTLSLDEFEQKLARAMQREGYSIVGCDGKTMTLRRSGEITLVCFARWREVPISAAAVRRMRALLVEHGAAGCQVLSAFAPSARMRALLSRHAIAVIGASEIAQLIDSDDAGRPAAGFDSAFVPAPPAHGNARGADSDQPTASEPSLASSPPCPRCGASMTHHTAGSGNALGQQFWVCTRAPACRGIRTAA